MLLDRSPRDLSAVGSGGLLAVNASKGSVALDFPLAPVDSRWVDRSYYGLTGDGAGGVWVSVLLQDDDYQHKQAALQHFSADGAYLGSLNTAVIGQLSLDPSQAVCWIAPGFEVAQSVTNVVQAVDLTTGATVAAFNPRLLFTYLFFLDVQSFVDARGASRLMLLASADKEHVNGTLAVVNATGGLQAPLFTLAPTPRALAAHRPSHGPRLRRRLPERRLRGAGAGQRGAGV